MSLVTPAMPSFADLQSQMGQQPPTTQLAPSGGALSPPAPASQLGAGGSSPPAQPVPSYLTELEQAGKVPAGRFKTERELIDALYGTASDLATQVEQYEHRVPPAQPEPPAPAVTPPAADLTKMATVFQQNGWLALQNGQWVATNTMATQIAQQMNNSILEAQARQAELSDPSAFIAKYGSDAIKQAVDPLRQQIDRLVQQNQQLQQQFEAAAPRPDREWVASNKGQLYAADAAGKEVPTPAGKAYGDAWEMARRAGIDDIAQIHQYALTVATPYLAPKPVAPAAPPAQTWMQQTVPTLPGVDPSFNAPGSVLNSSVPPTGIGIPTGNDGFPTFRSLQALGLQGQ